jgi:hypothetical protein
MGAATSGCDAGPGKSTIALKMFPARPRYADVKPVIRPMDRWRSVRRSSRQTSPIATRIRLVKNAVRCAASQARGCGRMAVAIPSQTPTKRKMNPWRSNRRRCDSIELIMDPQLYWNSGPEGHPTPDPMVDYERRNRIVVGQSESGSGRAIASEFSVGAGRRRAGISESRSPSSGLPLGPCLAPTPIETSGAMKIGPCAGHS